MGQNSRLSLALVIAVFAAFAVIPAASVAQDPANNPSAAQYNPPIPPDGQSAGSESAGASGGSGGSDDGGGGLSSSIGSLPFTGLDLIILAGVAFVLTGTGFALRRLSSPRGPSV